MVIIMDFLKSIIELITSFFKRSTVKIEQETTITDAKTEALINQIQATYNATIIEHNDEVQTELQELHEQHKQELDDVKTNPTNNPFGESW